MEKTIIQVPKGIRYFNEFENLYGFHLENYPYILDKKLPGCGFTTWVLTNSQNIILASPRKLLMKNKKDQLGNSIFLVNLQSIDLDIDKDLNKNSKSSQSNTYIETYDRTELKRTLSEYMLKRQFKHLPWKIVVTYDSYRKVKELLEELNIFQEFHTIVDEMQSIWVDVRFKPSTEIEFVELLKTVQKVCYVSATPMMEEYLELVDYFNSLPYHELDWITLEPERVKVPSIIPRTLKSINLAAKSIILPYKEGKFEKKFFENPETGEMTSIESREAVIYINSVTNIIGIIKACGLKPEEVNILCSDTPNNVKRIDARLNKKKQGIIYKIGSVPTEGQPRKMFTFCTRTVYLGADFYSDNARTFIFSDANIDTLAVDIVLDLPQILGRQRLIENPWKDEAIIYVKPMMRYKAMKEEDFKKELERKLKETQDLLTSYENTPDDAKLSLVTRFEKMAKDYNYRDDYVSVNHHAGSQPVPVFNNLVAIAEKRAFDIQQKDYIDRVMVLNKIASSGFNIMIKHSNTIQDFLNAFNNIRGTRNRIEFVCNKCPKFTKSEQEAIFTEISNFYRNFYLGLGPERCKALGYNYTLLDKEYSTKFFDVELVRNKILTKFSVGNKLSTPEIKTTLKDLYIELGYKKTPKASDLEEYFELRAIKLKNSSGKWIHGFEILKER